MRGSSTIQLSRRLSYVLRHHPDSIGVSLDEAGWVPVEALLDGLARHGPPVDRHALDVCVAQNDKQRFEFSADGLRIRARQGHSVEVELGYEAATPPPVLLHGTVARVLPSIRQQGLLPGNRHHVHLSAERSTAWGVGGRRGQPVVLRVDAAAMVRDGHVFYVTGNHVWLTAQVPPQYICFDEPG